MISVLLANDAEFVREGWRVVIGREPDLVVVGEAMNGEQALSGVEVADPDVVLMDVRMPVVDGITATRRLTERDPERPRVLLVTAYAETDEYLLGAYRACARGFFPVHVPVADLLNAIRQVCCSQAEFFPFHVRSLVEGGTRPATQTKYPRGITVREGEVLCLMCAGLSHAEIATTLYITERTVKAHAGSVYDKLGVDNRTQAVAWALKVGFTQQ